MVFIACIEDEVGHMFPVESIAISEGRLDVTPLVVCASILHDHHKDLFIGIGHSCAVIVETDR